MIGMTSVSCNAQDPGKALSNLAEKPDKPRFTITDRVWPQQVGEASVCLWKDDKIAAFSITIDDNSAPDVDWWIEQTKPLNLPLTWFIISGRVETANAYWGNWELWNRLRRLGHAVESHTVAHLHTELPEWKNIEWEYAESQRQIEQKMQGHRVLFLAYPGGANSKLNDRSTVAAKYYLAARGTVGTINMANQIDYLNTSGMSAPKLNMPKTPFADVKNLLVPNNRYYRGWAVLLFHKVNDQAFAKTFLDFYKDNAHELWGDTFGDVALYGQERDTAHLTVEENSPARITLALSDQMDDTRFSYPLTIKVRLPEDWAQVRATQVDKPIAAQVVEHQGERFALVQAVPDKGRIVLQAGL